MSDEFQGRYEDLVHMLNDTIDIASSLYWYDHNIYNEHGHMYLSMIQLYAKLTHNNHKQSKEQILRSINLKKMKEFYKWAQKYGEHFKVMDVNLFDDLLA